MSKSQEVVNAREMEQQHKNERESEKSDLKERLKILFSKGICQTVFFCRE
jgi:hypothetical protein